MNDQPLIIKDGIYQYPSPILSRPVANYDLDLPETEQEIHRDSMRLQSVLDQTPQGVAIAANQCGIRKSMFVHRLHGDYMTVINPRLHITPDQYVEDILIPEGCLSIPGMTVHIGFKRYRQIAVSYFEYPSLSFIEETIEDFEAQMFQHEYDHLCGMTILDRLYFDYSTSS